MTPARPLFVVDSSVVYKWFSADGETNVEQALDLMRAHCIGELLLAAPAHMPSEVLNGLRYAGLAREYLRRAPEKLSEAEIAMAPLDAELLSRALDLALAYDLTIHDALFPALAVQLDGELVTADRAQARVRECPVRLLA